MNRAHRAEALRALGWRVRTTGELSQVVRNFQRGWALGPALVVDGIAGPKTDAALDESLDRLKAGKPTASRFMSFHEFKCRCGGSFRSCARVWVMRDLLHTLDDVRERFYPGGLVVVSGCRCNGHNNAVGGAKSSQHLYGAACDVKPQVSRSRMAAADLAAGIGFNASSGLVAHIDRRDKSGHNTTGASLNHPTVWVYHR